MEEVQKVSTEELLKEMYKKRQKKLREKGMGEKEFRDEICGKTRVGAEELVRLGYLDGLERFEDVKAREVGSMPVYIKGLPPSGDIMEYSHWTNQWDLTWLMNNKFSAE